MAAVFERYTEEMRNEFGYLATWLPNHRLSLGDVGVLNRNRFDRVTTLADLGVNFSVGQGDTLNDLEYVSAGQVDVDWGVGNGAPSIDTVSSTPSGATVLFRRAHATLFQASRCVIETVLDLASLQRSVVDLHLVGQWQRRWVVVTELVRVGAAAIFISSEGGARVDLHVSGTLPEIPLSFAETAVDLRIASTSGMAVRLVTDSQLTPLYRVSGLRGGIVREPRLVFRGDLEPVSSGRPEGADASLTLSSVSYDHH